MNKFFKFLAAAVAGLVVVGATFADVTDDVTAIASDADTLFTTVSGIAIGIAALGILLYVIRKIRGR